MPESRSIGPLLFWSRCQSAEGQTDARSEGGIDGSQEVRDSQFGPHLASELETCDITLPSVASATGGIHLGITNGVRSMTLERLMK